MELLRYDDLWQSLIEHYENNQCILKAENFPTAYVKKQINSSKKSVHRRQADFFKIFEVEEDEDKLKEAELEQRRHEAWEIALQELPKAARKAFQQPKVPEPA